MNVKLNVTSGHFRMAINKIEDLTTSGQPHWPYQLYYVILLYKFYFKQKESGRGP